MRIRLSQDVVAGTFFCFCAIVGLMLSSRLHFGTPARMGPGFFPTGLSVILLVFGAIVLARSLRQQGDEIGVVMLRPLLTILAGVVLFSLVVERLGFAIAAAALILVSRAAGERFRPLESALLAAVLIAVSAALFLYALKLPLHLWPV